MSNIGNRGFRFHCLATCVVLLLIGWIAFNQHRKSEGYLRRQYSRRVSGSGAFRHGRLTQAALNVDYGKVPLTFEANQGQADPEVKFLARGSGYNLSLTGREAVLGLSRRPAHETAGHEEATLRMHLIGANPSAGMEGVGRLSGRVNYFIGNDPTKWQTDVPTFRAVRYTDVYPGVELLYYGNQRQLEFDFIVAPAADPHVITMGFGGAESLEFGAEGDLLVHTAGGIIRQHRPVIYQEKNGRRQDVAGGYRLKGTQEVGLYVDSYDTSLPLVIDPVLEYSTFLGGRGLDSGSRIALDSDGNIYVSGLTTSPDFPRVYAAQAGFGDGGNAFVTKLDPTGSSLVYSTYLGGKGHSSDAGCISELSRIFASRDFKGLAHTIVLLNCPVDAALGLAVDIAGNAYVTGIASSPDFPTRDALRPTLTSAEVCGSLPCPDAFVAKLNRSGSLVYSTFFGGTDIDLGLAIATDANGNAYVAGGTFSSDLPTKTPLQPSLRGFSDGFVAKLNPTGSALIYSTYLGGSAFIFGRGVLDDAVNGIAVDAAGNAYVTGTTSALDFPTVNPFQATKGGGGFFGADAYVAKLNPTGSALIYSTYLGGGAGGGGDTGLAIAVDAGGSAYITGQANSSDFPTFNAIQASSGGGGDAYVTKLNASGSALVYSTYLGGNDLDQGAGIALDGAGNAYVTGFTSSTNFPVVNAVQSTLNGFDDIFVVKLNPTGTTLVYATYLGGSDFDEGGAIAVDSAGNAYVTGSTQSADFPTVNPYQSVRRGLFSDAFVAKLRAP
jgi:hypothetical protein